MKRIGATDELMGMDPIELAEKLRKEVDFGKIENLNSPQLVTDAINKTISYASYFKELETIARIKKRQAKREKLPPEEQDRRLGVEEVFETYKRIAEMQFDKITKMMTAKRLHIDEIKFVGSAT